MMSKGRARRAPFANAAASMLVEEKKPKTKPPKTIIIYKRTGRSDPDEAAAASSANSTAKLTPAFSPKAKHWGKQTQAQAPDTKDTLTELERVLNAAPELQRGGKPQGLEESLTSSQQSGARTRPMGSQESSQGTDYNDSAEIRRGDTVLLKKRDGNMVDVHVVDVDKSARPPAYLIRTNTGTERPVERSRLFVPIEKPNVPQVVELEHMLKDLRRKSTAGSHRDRPRRQKLEVMVLSARNVPELSGTSPERQHALTLVGRNVPGMLYVKLKYMGKERESTKRWDDRNPEWDERFPVGLHNDDGDPDEDEDMEVRVMEHYEGVRDRMLGKCVVSGLELQAAPLEGEGEAKEMALVLYDSRGKKVVSAENKTFVIRLTVKRRVVPPGDVSRASLRSSGLFEGVSKLALG